MEPAAALKLSSLTRVWTRQMAGGAVPVEPIKAGTSPDLHHSFCLECAGDAPGDAQVVTCAPPQLPSALSMPSRVVCVHHNSQSSMLQPHLVRTRPSLSQSRAKWAVHNMIRHMQCTSVAALLLLCTQIACVSALPALFVGRLASSCTAHPDGSLGHHRAPTKDT